MADHPDEIADMAHQWELLAEEVSTGRKRLTHLLADPSAAQVVSLHRDLLTRLDTGYRNLAAKARHYATWIAHAAEKHREARAKMEQLGPPWTGRRAVVPARTDIHRLPLSTSTMLWLLCFDVSTTGA